MLESETGMGGRHAPLSHLLSVSLESMALHQHAAVRRYSLELLGRRVAVVDQFTSVGMVLMALICVGWKTRPECRCYHFMSEGRG